MGGAEQFISRFSVTPEDQLLLLRQGNCYMIRFPDGQEIVIHDLLSGYEFSVIVQGQRLEGQCVDGEFFLLNRPDWTKRQWFIQNHVGFIHPKVSDDEVEKAMINKQEKMRRTNEEIHQRFGSELYDLENGHEMNQAESRLIDPPNQVRFGFWDRKNKNFDFSFDAISEHLMTWTWFLQQNIPSQLQKNDE